MFESLRKVVVHCHGYLRLIDTLLELLSTMSSSNSMISEKRIKSVLTRKGIDWVRHHQCIKSLARVLHKVVIILTSVVPHGCRISLEIDHAGTSLSRWNPLVDIILMTG
jgi:hypothetical protein